MSAWNLAQQIRAGFAVYMDKLIGTVEVGWSYLGGKEKNKHANKRFRAGCGIVGKLSVAGLRERETGRIIAEPFVAATTIHLSSFVTQNTVLVTKIYAEELPAYNAVNRSLETVARSQGEYVRDDAYGNGSESIWAELKRSHHGTYHWWSRKHLARFVAESVWRHNHGEGGVLERMAAAAIEMAGQRLRYADLAG